jgi:hypothetical protein
MPSPLEAIASRRNDERHVCILNGYRNALGMHLNMNRTVAIKCLLSLPGYKHRVDDGTTIVTYDAVDKADEDDILLT